MGRSNFTCYSLSNQKSFTVYSPSRVVFVPSVNPTLKSSLKAFRCACTVVPTSSDSFISPVSSNFLWSLTYIGLNRWEQEGTWSGVFLWMGESQTSPICKLPDLSPKMYVVRCCHGECRLFSGSYSVTFSSLLLLAVLVSQRNTCCSHTTLFQNTKENDALVIFMKQLLWLCTDCWLLNYLGLGEVVWRHSVSRAFISVS